MVDSIGGSQFNYDADFDVSGVEQALDKVLAKLREIKNVSKETSESFKKIFMASINDTNANKGNSDWERALRALEGFKDLPKDILLPDFNAVAKSAGFKDIINGTEKVSAELKVLYTQSINQIKEFYEAQKEAEKQAETTTESAEKKKQASKKETNKKIKENTEALKEEAQVAEETATRVEQAEAKKQKAYEKTKKEKESSLTIKEAMSQSYRDDKFQKEYNERLSRQALKGDYITLSNGNSYNYRKIAESLSQSLVNKSLEASQRNAILTALGFESTPKIIEQDTSKMTPGEIKKYNERINLIRNGYDGSTTNKNDIYKFLTETITPEERSLLTKMVVGEPLTQEETKALIFNNKHQGSDDSMAKIFEDARKSDEGRDYKIDDIIGLIKYDGELPKFKSSNDYRKYGSKEEALKDLDDTLLNVLFAPRKKILKTADYEKLNGNDDYINSLMDKSAEFIDEISVKKDGSNIKQKETKQETTKAVEDLSKKAQEEVKKVEKAIEQASDKIQEKVKTPTKSNMSVEDQNKLRAEMASMQKENQAYLEKMANKNVSIAKTTPSVKKQEEIIKKTTNEALSYDPFASIVKGKMSWEDRRSLRGYYNFNRSQFSNDNALLYSRATGKPVLTTDVVDIKDLVQDKTFYGGMDWKTRRSLRGYYGIYNLSQFYDTGGLLIGNPYDNNPYTKEQQNLMQAPEWVKARGMSWQELSQIYTNKIKEAPLMLEDKSSKFTYSRDKAFIDLALMQYTGMDENVRQALRNYYGTNQSPLAKGRSLLYSRATGKQLTYNLDDTDTTDWKTFLHDRTRFGANTRKDRQAIRDYYYRRQSLFNDDNALLYSRATGKPINEIVGSESAQKDIVKESMIDKFLNDTINKVKQWGQNFKNSWSTNLQDTFNIVSAFQEDMRNMANNIRTFFITLSSVIYSVTNVVKQLENVMSITDNITSTASRFERYDTTGASKDTLLAKLFKYSNGARSDIDSFGTLAQRILATDVTQGNGEEAMKLASIITKAMVLGGSTGQEISSAQLQLSQGLAANQLGGDELKALRENAVGFTEMLAKGLNKGYEQGIFTNSAFKGAKIGNLKDIGAKGLLTAEVVTKALTLMSDEIDSEFGKMPVLFSQTLNKLTNKFKEKLNEFNKEGRGLSRITNMFEKLANFIDTERGERIINNLMNMLDNFISFIERIGNLLSGVLGNETLMNVLEKGVGLWAYAKVGTTIASGLLGTSNSSGLIGSGGLKTFISNLFLNSQAGLGIGETIWTSLFRQNKTGVVGGLIPSILLGLKTFITGKDENITGLTGVIKYINELNAHPNNSYNKNKYINTIASLLRLSGLEENLEPYILDLLQIKSANFTNGEIAKLLSNENTMKYFTVNGSKAVEKAVLEAGEAKKVGAGSDEVRAIFKSSLEGAGFAISGKATTTGVLDKISAGLLAIPTPLKIIAGVIGAIAVALGAWNHFDKKAEEKDWTDFKDKYLNFDGHKYLTDEAKEKIIDNVKAQYDAKYDKNAKFIGGVLTEDDAVRLRHQIDTEVYNAENEEYLKQISENTAKTADNTAGSFEITEEFLRNMNDIQTRQFKAQLGMSGYNGGVQNTWSVVINNQSDLNNLVEQLSTAVVQSQEASLV